MDSDQGKLFIGGISWETTEDRLKDYFKSFGDVVEAVIMKDRTTGRARGFGFVVFSDPAVADRVVLDKHIIDGRTVEAKKAVPRDDQQSINRVNNIGHGSLNQARTKKIFVGGLASTVTETDFRKYFEQFGTITDVVVMYDHGTQRPRGFGFITFDSEDAVDKVLLKNFHDLNGKMVEVKKAVPKELSPSPARTPIGGFGLGGNRGSNFSIGYGVGQTYNSSPAAGYGVRMDNRYGPNSGGRGGYPTFPAAGYGMSATFGPGMNQGYNGASFSSSFNYGTSPGVNYGGTSSGYGGPVGYGGSNAGNGTYTNTQSGGRNMWSQGSLGYSSPASSAGYMGGGSGNMTGYASATRTWGSSSTSGSGQAVGSSSSLASGSFGYGNVENGYGPSALSSGSYAGRNTGYGVGNLTYGSFGSATGGYGGAYTEMYRSSGYGDTTWGSGTNDSGGSLAGYGLSSNVTDGPSNGSTSYVGGYGDTGRQTHRGVAA